MRKEVGAVRKGSQLQLQSIKSLRTVPVLLTQYAFTQIHTVGIHSAYNYCVPYRFGTLIMRTAKCQYGL